LNWSDILAFLKVGEASRGVVGVELLRISGQYWRTFEKPLVRYSEIGRITQKGAAMQQVEDGLEHGVAHENAFR
jgi:hypothetical protein